MNWDYIAGVFDGEGYTRFSWIGGQRRFQIGILITNNSIEKLSSIKNFLESQGIKTSLNSKRKEKNLQIQNAKSVKSFCENIIPLTQVPEKKRELEIVLEVSKIALSKSLGKTQYNKEEQNKLYSLYSTFCFLRQRKGRKRIYLPNIIREEWFNKKRWEL